MLVIGIAGGTGSGKTTVVNQIINELPEDIKQYVKLHIASCKTSNIRGVWSGSLYTQAKPYYDFLDKMYPQQKRICAQALEPFYFTDHSEYRYSDVFKNKKVLIISYKEASTLL